MVLAPLPGTKAALMLSLCALSPANPPTFILLRPLLKTGTFIVEFQLCPDTNRFPLLEAATAQHASTLTRLKKQTGATRQKSKSLASKLSYRAIQRVTPFINTRYALHFQGASGGGWVLDTWQWRAGEGESGHPGAWPITLPYPHSIS
eukprot:592764-Pelagomonas_calceolata.AAC.1